ncbi:MAG: hypothetical protein RLZZ606_873 [Actinomycetota bacterium]|jgi:hypothetical protein
MRWYLEGMKKFDSEKLKKKINKKINKKIGKKKAVNIEVNKKSGGFAYFLGFIGAAIFYVSTAPDFWAGALGLIKAALWPAFLVYAALNGLNA